MFSKKRESVIQDYIRSNHEKIKVLPGVCRYNFQCHSNAVHDAVIDKDKHIAMVVYFDNGSPAAHFINYRKKQFVDNTLGVWSSQMEYYLIRFVNEEEFFDVYRIHRSYRKFIKSIIPWYLRIFHGLNDI